MTYEDQTRNRLGEFGPKPHSFPEVALAEEVHGSFLFPPSSWPGGAAQYMEFWQKQPISDEALNNFASAYAFARDDFSATYIEQAVTDWGNSLEGLRAVRDAGDDGYKLRSARLAFIAQVEEELEDNYPARIDMGLVRDVARAAQIMHNRDRLKDPAEQEAVADVVIYSAPISGNTFTARELAERYRVAEIMPDAFYPRENAVARMLRSMSPQ